MKPEAQFKLKIPSQITQYIRPDAPRDAKLMAANGFVPMAPPILATALILFLSDVDEEIREAAHKSLTEMPDNVVSNIVKDQLHPKALDFFARTRFEQQGILDSILLNPLTTDDSFVFLAPMAPEESVTIIANNQVRLLRTPAIAEGLRKNPNALRSTVDRMVSFLRISGIFLEGESAELTREEIKQIVQEPATTPEAKLPEVVVKELPAEEVTEEKKKSIYQQIMTMNVSQKVKLAIKGNKEARSILVKETNKIIASAVVKNPGITDGEIMAIASSRTVSDDVIRIIARNPDWVKNYNLQVILANNPKTPFPIALKFTRNLRVSDLKKIVSNKNIPGQINKIAKELYEKKRK